MKITCIYSTARKEKSTTYNVTQKFLRNLSEGDKVHEFFLPKDMPHFCGGCFSCLSGCPEKCPGYEYIKPIREAISASTLIIFAVPVYVYHAPGQVKALLDHFAYSWMVHQLNGEMFKKQALIITTAAGAGLKSTVKDVMDSMNFWGVARVHVFKRKLFKANYTELSEKDRQDIEKDVNTLSKRILKRSRHLTPRIREKIMFYGCRLMHRHLRFNPVDVAHWESHGWLDKIRPWK